MAGNSEYFCEFCPKSMEFILSLGPEVMWDLCIDHKEHFFNSEEIKNLVGQIKINFRNYYWF